MLGGAAAQQVVQLGRAAECGFDQVHVLEPFQQGRPPRPGRSGRRGGGLQREVIAAGPPAVTRGVRVAGDVHAIFEYIEPKAAGLPDWLDLDVPDDRLVASALRLQSRHPGSALFVATSDINLQTKLAAVALPFIEP